MQPIGEQPSHCSFCSISHRIYICNLIYLRRDYENDYSLVTEGGFSWEFVAFGGTSWRFSHGVLFLL